MLAFNISIRMPAKNLKQCIDSIRNLLLNAVCSRVHVMARHYISDISRYRSATHHNSSPPLPSTHILMHNVLKNKLQLWNSLCTLAHPQAVLLPADAITRHPPCGQQSRGRAEFVPGSRHQRAGRGPLSGDPRSKPLPFPSAAAVNRDIAAMGTSALRGTEGAGPLFTVAACASAPAGLCGSVLNASAR